MVSAKRVTGWVAEPKSAPGVRSFQPERRGQRLWIKVFVDGLLVAIEFLGYLLDHRSGLIPGFVVDRNANQPAAG